MTQHLSRAHKLARAIVATRLRARDGFMSKTTERTHLNHLWALAIADNVFASVQRIIKRGKRA